MNTPGTPVRSAVRSVAGRNRATNQDRYAVDHELGFAVLADGVAGRPAGERAAELAIDAAAIQLRLVLSTGSCSDLQTAQRLVRDAVALANATVRRNAAFDPALANMATTLDCVVFVRGHAVIAHLGNARVYRLRHAFLKRLTDDHIMQRAGSAVLSRAELDALRPLQLLTRAVGLADTPEPDVFSEPLMAGDVFLLCSNGLSDALERHEMGELLARAGCLDDACELLARAAVTAGADDDVTALLVRPELPPGAAR